MTTSLYPQPEDAAQVPRYAGLPTFMRLPMWPLDQLSDLGASGASFGRRL